MTLQMALTEAERDELADSFADGRLEVGKRYRAIGPAPTSKLGPPPEVLVVGVDAFTRRYAVEPLTKGQTAKVIAFGAEGLWTETHVRGGA